MEEIYVGDGVKGNRPVDDLMGQILSVLPNAVIGEDFVTGEIVVSTGFREVAFGDLMTVE
jgi:hypothetical protein